MRWSVLVIFLVIDASFIGCFSTGSAGNLPCEQPAVSGVALSFDDLQNIESWNESRDFLNENGIKATFYVDGIWWMSDERKKILHNLVAEGHEIGLHGMNHRDYFIHLENGGSAQEYFDDEVLHPLHLMRDEGFSIETFAYPMGHRDSEIDTLILEELPLLRGTRSIEEGSNHWLVSCEDVPIFRAISITDSQDSLPILLQYLPLAESKSNTLVMYSHSIAGNNDPVSYENLTIIADEVQRLGLPWLHMSDLTRD
jgi:peptidoglycan/xylan/chitin deacetylase (PgdA/CDA1 family)